MSIETLYDLGFSLILLQKNSKRPVDNAWSSGDRIPLSKILRGWKRGHNIGFRVGEPSKTDDGYYIHGIDLDIRKEEDEDEANEVLRELFGNRNLKLMPCVQSGSGGPSRHYYFLLKRPITAKVLAHSSSKYLDEKRNSQRWRWEIEIFGTGKQMVLPPSIHPDTGEPYRWVRDLEDGIPVLDDEAVNGLIFDLESKKKQATDEDFSQLGLTFKEAEEIIANLDQDEWFGSRDQWIKVAMALHHEFDGSRKALRILEKYSSKQEGFNKEDQDYQWGWFDRNEKRMAKAPIRMATLKQSANENALRMSMQPTEEDHAEARELARRQAELNSRKKKTTSKPRKLDKTENGPEEITITASDFEDLSDLDTEPDEEDTELVKLHNALVPKQLMDELSTPRELLRVPGVLGEVCDIYNNTAPSPQPQFAVVAALAFGSVILGRNWRVTHSRVPTMSSLYFLMLAPTASGKEHSLTVQRNIMEEMQLSERFVGPKKYASEAGFFGALMQQPRHITFLDEFNRMVAIEKASPDKNSQEVRAILMEAWGRLGGAIRNKAYSPRGRTAAEVEADRNAMVMRPAVTILAAGVPSGFWDSVDMAMLKDGFLNRFLIVETDAPTVTYKMELIEEIENQILGDQGNPYHPSKKLKRWIREHVDGPLSEDEEDFLDQMNTDDPRNPREYGEFTFDPMCLRNYDNFRSECARADAALEHIGMSGVWGRAAEIALRLTMIVAASCGSHVLKSEHFKWSYSFIRYYMRKVVARLKTDMGTSEDQKMIQHLFEYVDAKSKTAKLGATLGDIKRDNHTFRNLPDRRRQEIIKLLMDDKGVKLRLKVRREGSRQTCDIYTTNEDL